MEVPLTLPLAILATHFDLTSHGEEQIFGFLYFSEEVPPEGEARKEFTSDLVSSRCCQVSIKGTSSQLESLLRVAAVSSGWSFANAFGIAECIREAKEHRLPFGFDNLEEPTGRGLPIEIPLQLAGTFEEFQQKLESVRDQLDVTLHPAWMPDLQ